MTGPAGRAATAAAVAALTEYLDAIEQGAPRTVGDYLQAVVQQDGIGSLAQGYFGLLDLAALLLPERPLQQQPRPPSTPCWSAPSSPGCSCCPSPPTAFPP